MKNLKTLSEKYVRITTPNRSPIAALGRRAKKTTTAVGAVMAVGALAFTAACTIDQGSGSNNSEVSASSAANAQDTEKVELKSTVKDGSTSVPVSTPLEVSSTEKIDSVTLINPEGVEVEGTFNKDRTTWTAGEKLGFGRQYTLKAKSGKETLKQTFTTVTAYGTQSYSLAPLDGSTVGVGQTIALRFDSAVADREAVEEAITVETSPKVEGAFYWITAQEVRWRPENYWKPGTEVTVTTDLYGVEIGDGVYGTADQEASFTIGDETRAVVDDATKTMTIYQNGQATKTMPVSLGRDGTEYATPNGVYMVGDQHESILMDSSTFGLAVENGGYKKDVAYATQMSYSGIYIHSAPWSVWAQGNTNTSHGCVNVSPENALWVLNNFKRGDIVEVKNTTGSTLSGSDGLGDWNIDWKTWKAGNAKG
ncbi:MAG TPA: L,D-transpeptidase family protein [Candidatus Corynebacterium gallistercoris]|uniref:L,D-transpeptidase family protein n=1 Tax=Candidatus Corynebacterium gallistercoris TaxID=2838530 RepID=A0A9D1RYC0_9CORY|nr:L,D-transpeptidase family protein [Candidatus Corynebacterium gallistercoris]